MRTWLALVMNCIGLGLSLLGCDRSRVAPAPALASVQVSTAVYARLVQQDSGMCVEISTDGGKTMSLEAGSANARTFLFSEADGLLWIYSGDTGLVRYTIDKDGQIQQTVKVVAGRPGSIKVPAKLVAQLPAAISSSFPASQ
ncbi:MAG: hypothetical protein QM770_01295 [Tepidisphaeraceae bacterium]